MSPVRLRRQKFSPYLLSLSLSLVLVAGLLGCSNDGVQGSPTTSPSTEGELTYREAWDRFAACLEDAGLVVERLPDGSLQVDRGDLSIEASQAINDRCNKESGLLEAEQDELSEPEIRAVYDRWVNETKPCLEEEGYEIADPPSVETFLDTWEEGPWSPYLSIEGVGQTEFDRLMEVCPEAPDPLAE